MIGEAIYNLFYYEIFEDDATFLTKSFWGKWYIAKVFPFVVGYVIIFPLCLIKDVSKLRVFSMFGVFTLIGLICLLGVECPKYVKYYKENKYKEEDPSTHLNIYHAEKGFQTDLYFFQFCASLYYSYITTIGAVPIFNSLKNNVLRRIQKVVRRTVIFDIFLFLVIAIIGYLTWPVGTPDLIIERPKITRGPDIPMSIGRIALVLTIIFKMPSNYNSLRLTIFNTIWETTTITTKKNFFVTVVVLFICCTVSVLYSEISGYIKLIGGICSSIVGFIFPAMLYTRSNDLPRWHWKNIMTILIFSLFSVVGFISAGRTVFEMTQGYK